MAIGSEHKIENGILTIKPLNKMTKTELFQKYSIDESHSLWEGIDSWMSVEIYRIMHGGKLPPPDDQSTKWVVGFLDKFKDDGEFRASVMTRKEGDWGSLFLTAKRMVYSFAEQIIQESEATQ